MAFSKIIIDPLWDKYIEIEHEFILAAADLLSNEQLLEVWINQPFLGQQQLRQELDKIVVSTWNKSARKDLKNMFEKSAKTTLESDERAFRYAYERGRLEREPVPIKKSQTLQNILAGGFMSVQKAMQTALTIARTSTVARLNQAVLSVASGRVSLTKAIKEAAQELASNGVNGYVYPSGATIGLPEYIRRELITGVMNTTRNLSFARAEEWGSNLILISAHAGARPGCFPYQGNVYSRPGVIQEGWPSLENDTSYGEPAGIFGINCRHFPMPWFEGLNDLYTAAERDPASQMTYDNEKIYELTQEQRYNERQIRAWKRRANIQKEAGLDPEHAWDKVREWQKIQRDFIAGHKYIRRAYNREAAS